jgi:hypothetical protein
LCPTIDAHVKACVVVKSIVKTLVEAVVERHTFASWVSCRFVAGYPVASVLAVIV